MSAVDTVKIRGSGGSGLRDTVSLDCVRVIKIR
jgi:hypothetical protein